MLSRTADGLFWMARYLERAECTVRLIEMGRRMALVPGATNRDEWRSVVKASGAAASLDVIEQIHELDAIDILLLSKENVSSIRSCIESARTNGRTIRTALTQEMWVTLNEGWRRLETMDKYEASRDLPQIIEWVKTRSAALRGTSEIGMLRNDGYDFLRLGMYLERADMMLRLMDVKYYVLLPETEVAGGGRDHQQWTSVLLANSAVRAYHHIYGSDYSPWKIADFLILNEDFPRSLSYCYRSIGTHLERLSMRYKARQPCHDTATEMISKLSNIEMGEIFQSGLHEFITDTIDVNARLSHEIGMAYLLLRE